MPISRYQIRNEYSLADPELYKAADKDDPEALLEGVAMAGLVGVLRQLGDLAEFAAEVFHDLHEEVLATSARGHSLMVRVQQLEADFPSIEKAFLSQTNHSSFFYNSGIEWHPNMRMDQNLITRGDMPRFLMDSYEECRGPPRLFLLDKFDVAGAGACLKRYTDPSFFRVETSALDMTNADIQREKRTRKGKKKGSRWRNGEIPEVLPTPHAKLHQLLLEERIENTISDPARRVKLKRRLNGFPFDLKTGESYMEKFLKIPSPEHKVVHEISVSSSPLKLPAFNTCESGLDIHEVSLESPDKKFRHGSLSPTRDLVGTVQKHSRAELNGVTSENGFCKSPKANRSNGALSTFCEELGEKDIAAYAETKTEGSIDGYRSDDVASEVDNYVDALATMESEIDTDSELRHKSDLHILGVKRRMAGYGATEAEHQAPFSDSQSMGSSMLSEDGNSLSKKEISSSTYSDTRSISAENTPLEGEVSTEILLVNEMCEDKGTARLLMQENVNEGIGQAPSTELSDDDGGSEVAEIPAYRSDRVEQTISNITVMAPSLLQMDADSTPRGHVIVEAAEEMPNVHSGPEADLTDNRESDTNLNVIVTSDFITLDTCVQTENGSSPRVADRKQAAKCLDDTYPKTDDILPRDTSEIPWRSRDDSSLGDSAKSQYLEDMQSEESLSSLSSSHRPLDELGKDKSITEQPPEWSPKYLPVDRLEREDPNVSGANDDHVDVLTDSSVNLPSAISVAPEDDKSKSSLDSNPQTENTEQNRLEEHIGNQIYVPILMAPHAEEKSPRWALPLLETRDTVTESDNMLSAPDDVILPASGGQSLEQCFLPPDTHDTVMKSDHVVSECDDVIPPTAEVSFGLSSVIECPNDVHSVDLNILGATDDIQPVDPAVNSTGNQVDLPINVLSHLDEKSLESSVLESPKDFHSEAFQISGITDDTHPVDPAVCMTVNQNDSKIPVIPHLDEKSLDQTWLEVETHSKGAEPDDSIPDDMVRPAVEITGDMEPTTESLTTCNLKKVQASVIDVRQPDSAETGISDSSEQILNERLSLEDGVKMDGATPSINLLGRDAADFVISPDCKSSARNVNLGDADAERDEADTVSLEGSLENAEDHGASLSLSLKKLDEESLSNYEQSNLNKMEAQASIPDSYSEVDVPDILKVASRVADSDLGENLCHDHTEPEVLGNVPDSFPLVESSLDLGNAARPSSPRQHSGLGNTVIPSPKSYFTDYTEDISLLPICDAEEQKIKLSHGQLDNEETKVSQNAAGANLELLPQSEQKESADHLDQEGCSYTGSVSSLADLPVQESVSEILPEDHHSIGEIGQLKVPFSSSPFELLPEAKINLDEMPPLPPLPPVQWRMGKHQHASSAQETEALPSNFGAFMSFSPSIADQKPQILKPFLPQYDIAGGSSHVVYENTSSHPASDGPTPIVHHENNKTSLAPLCEAQSVNKLLPLPEKSDEIPQDDSHVGEIEKVQPSSSTSSQVTSVDTASTYLCKLPLDEESHTQHQVAPETSSPVEELDLVSAHPDGNIIPHDNDLQSKKENEQPKTVMPSPKGEISWRSQEDGHQVAPETHDEEIHIQHEVAPETCSADEKLDRVSAHSDGNMFPHDNDLLQSKKENEQPRTVMPSPKGEIAWPSQEDGKANGGLTTKLPRPRNPLIDAVVAHDKSKLRKVAQHPRPQIQKADERDSILEQIRTKSFNLKPTVVTRPSIQGPTTNLKVAAILEKAKTIRQAFAGSDEDDDDSWSDS